MTREYNKLCLKADSNKTRIETLHPVIAREVALLEKILSEILSYIREVGLEKYMVNIDYLVEEVTAVMKSELDETLKKLKKLAEEKDEK